MGSHFDGGAPQTHETDEPYVFTSVRFDRRLLTCDENTAASCGFPCPFYMLEHHWTRLQVAKWSTFFFADDRPRPNSGGPSAFFDTLLGAVKQWHEKNPSENPEALRVRITEYVGGRMKTEIYHPLKSIPVESLFPTSFELHPQAPTQWTVCLDKQPTEPSEGTMFKTNDRSMYGRARMNAQIVNFQVPREVLLWTPEKEILDASICTPYFYRDGRWVTPEAAVGGLQGTTRRWALEKNLCSEGVIPVDSLRNGEIVWLSNAVRGYFYATFEM
jgi:hypothetical protein